MTCRAGGRSSRARELPRPLPPKPQSSREGIREKYDVHLAASRTGALSLAKTEHVSSGAMCTFVQDACPPPVISQ